MVDKASKSENGEITQSEKPALLESGQYAVFQCVFALLVRVALTRLRIIEHS